MKYNMKRIQQDELPLLPFFLASLFLGLVITWIWKSEFLDAKGVLSESALYQMRTLSVDRRALFFSVFRKRFGDLFIVLLLGTTYLCTYTVWIYLMQYGVLIGVLFNLLLFRYGLKGILLMLISLFPHYLVYVPILVSAFGLCKKRRYINRRFLIQSLFLVVCMVVGCILESYVNPFLVNSFLQIF